MCQITKSPETIVPGSTKPHSAFVGERLKATSPGWAYHNKNKNHSVIIECEHSGGRKSLHTVGPGEMLTDEDPDVILTIKKIE